MAPCCDIALLGIVVAAVLFEDALPAAAASRDEVVALVEATEMCVVVGDPLVLQHIPEVAMPVVRTAVQYLVEMRVLG